MTANPDLIVNERTTSYLTVSFYNKSGALESPASASYKVHDAATGTELVAETNIDPISASPQLTLPPAAAVIVNSTLSVEEHIVTVKGVYGASDEANGEYRIFVKNLRNIPFA